MYNLIQKPARLDMYMCRITLVGRFVYVFYANFKSSRLVLWWHFNARFDGYVFLNNYNRMSR